MGTAVDTIQSEISKKGSSAVTTADIESWLDIAAAARHRAASEGGGVFDHDVNVTDQYGLKLPVTEEGLTRFREITRERWRGGLNTEMEDELTPENRHAAFFDRADSLITRLSGSAGVVSLQENIGLAGGQTYLGGLYRQRNSIVYIHPSLRRSIEIRDRAYTLWAKALNDTTLSEREAMDHLAAAYRLLCVAQPYYRGTPAILEVAMDASLRARFGKTLPTKVSEPFWGAVLWDGRHPYGGDDFLASYERIPPLD